MSSGLTDWYGPGMVMCCLCFGGFTVDGLYLLPCGMREDVCQECAILEAYAIERNKQNVKECFWCGAKTRDNWKTDNDHEAGICFIAGPNS